MTADRIFVDASVLATLNHGKSELSDYQTLFEAVMAWHKLPLRQKKLTTVEVLGGPTFSPYQIERLYMGHIPRRP
jgi:hypothetical protein